MIETKGSLISLKEATEVLFGESVSLPAMYTFCKKGIIPFIRLGSMYMIPVAWVNMVLKETQALAEGERPSFNLFTGQVEVQKNE